MSKEKVSRRGYVKYAAAGVVVVGVAAGGAYYATRPKPTPTPIPTPTPTPTATPTVKPTPTPEEQIELNFYTTGHSGFFYDVGRLGWKPVERYMEANPNIKINTFVDAYFDVYTKEAATFAAGTYAWDVAYTHGSLIREFHQYLTPLDEMGINISEEVKEDIIPYPRAAIYNPRLNGGTWYGLPRMFEIFTLMANADILDAEGLEFPRSFEEMIEVFKAVHKPDRGQYAFQVGLKEGYLIPPFLCFLHGAGGDHVDWKDSRQILLTDSEETIKAVKDMVYVYDNFMDPASIEKIAFVESSVDWFNGHMVFGLFYPWPTLAVVEPDSAVKRCYTWLWPGHEGVVRAASQTANEGYAIPRQAKYKQEAWEFIQYLNSKEVDVQKMLNMGYKQENEEPMVCRWSYLEDERLYDYPYNLTLRASLVMSKYNANRYEARPYFHALNAAVEAGVIAAITKAENVEDSLKFARERTDETVADEFEKYGSDFLQENISEEMQKHISRIDDILKRIPVEEEYILPE